MEPQSATPAYTFATATGLALEACFDGGRLTSDGGLPWLAEAEDALRARINSYWMREGVRMVDPCRTYIDASVTLGSEVEVDGSTVRIRRDGDTATETVEGRVPLVLSVTDQSGEARYPSFKGIMAAKKKPVQTWSLADLGVDAELVGLSAA